MDKRFSSENLNNIINELLSSIEKSKKKAFTFYESTIEVVLEINEDFEVVSKEMREILEKIKEKTKESKACRKELISITNMLKNSGEEYQSKYETVYKKADRLMLEVNYLEKRYSKVFNKKNELDRRMLKSKQFLTDSEDLLQSITASMRYLDSDLTNISNHLSEKEEVLLRVVRAGENEKKSISRDIHDGPAQTLVSALIEVQILKEVVKKECSSVVVDTIDNISNSIKDALRETRLIIYDLRPMALDDLGLIPALEEYIEDFDKGKEMKARFNLIDGENLSNKIPDTLSLVIFRVIQESLNNASKHSQASNVVVNLEIFNGEISILIQDDGVGFNVNEVLKAKKEDANFGLLGMRERIALASGKIKIVSSEGEGTRINIKIPYITQTKK